jgi:hypothetical protein
VKLPNAECAIVEERKIIEYLLNPVHPDGASKAHYFIAAGFTAANWSLLANALRNLAMQSPVSSTSTTPHGIKYVLDGDLQTPKGIRGPIRTVWIVDPGATGPRLVTAHPCG